jgi:hypothetical protein
MGRIELLIILVFALIYLTFPVITLVIVLQINKRLKRIEEEVERLRSAS